MAMSTGGGGGAGPLNEINVTPMIDVLLVLLVIFMMAVPATRKALDVQVPDPTPPEQQSNPQENPDQIVLQVLPDGHYKINSEDVSKDRLLARLKEIYDPRPDKIIFIKGDPAVTYQDVIHAMDVSRGAGVRVIGLPPK